MLVTDTLGRGSLGCAPRPWQLLRKWCWAQTGVLASSCWPLVADVAGSTATTQPNPYYSTTQAQGPWHPFGGGDTLARGSRGGDDHPGYSPRSPPRMAPPLSGLDYVHSEGPRSRLRCTERKVQESGCTEIDNDCLFRDYFLHDYRLFVSDSSSGGIARLKV